MTPEEIVRFYRKNGLKENFVSIKGKEFPVIFHQESNEPHIEFLDKEYTMDIRSKAFQKLLKEIQERVIPSYVTNAYDYRNNTFYFNKIRYDLRTMFTIFPDKKLSFGKSLRELTVDYIIKDDGRLAPISEYPFPKSVGTHIIIINNKTIYLQVRSDNVLDPGMIDPTAAGALEFNTHPIDNVLKELKEESGIDKVKSIKYIGYSINLRQMYDVAFLYVAESDMEPKPGDESKEFIPIELGDSLIDEIKPYMNNMNETVSCFIEYFSKQIR